MDNFSDLYDRAIRLVADRIRGRAEPFDFSSDVNLIASIFKTDPDEIEAQVVRMAKALIKADIDDGDDPHWLCPNYRKGMQALDV